MAIASIRIDVKMQLIHSRHCKTYTKNTFYGLHIVLLARENKKLMETWIWIANKEKLIFSEDF